MALAIVYDEDGLLRTRIAVKNETGNYTLN